VPAGPLPTDGPEVHPLLAVPAILIAAFLFGRYSQRGISGREGPPEGGVALKGGDGAGAGVQER